ncbi:MAG: 3-phosphoshikimate 1-carboxyvinyltransferase [Deltaproteobacteria bacterium]|nr:3-phosphoshikimate 1-carboxyvinyltransferase [Deltaproteobacteria bacterium]
MRGPIRATPSLPGSKSLTNRALVIAALADGDGVLRGALDGDDTRHMVAALERLGFAVDWDRGAATIRVAGRAGVIPSRGAELFGGNAGTTVRFLTSLVALGHGRFTIDGDPRMRERPIQDLLDGLVALGVAARSARGNGCPPVVVEAAGLAGGEARIAGETSSQFTSSLLLVAPYAARDVRLTVTGDLVGAPFVDMTLALMERHGVRAVRSGNEIRVACGQRYRGGEMPIEPDATAASYFLAAAALLGGAVTVPGLGPGSLQGDVAFAEVLAEMGAEVRSGATGLTVVGRTLRGADRDFRAISDTFLTAAALAPFASSPTRIRGIGHTRRQETDRVSAVARELSRLGVRVEEGSDELRIEPSLPHGGEVETYGDHRMAMSFALIGLRVAGIRIRDPRCVEKTFPDFFRRLESLRPTE